ncbi:hypothetical protein PPIS_a0686 [Pseudoalteromonas piscicida]|uniref:Uncharacterized protein n=1 Tax=Pseudoalteromonas piscicida TaxID=43662 RepID=A0ABM6NAM8_PSEO7|nr:hypothetical protein PPIS_a0686 [Pseudoalteromonas piscicida]
MFNSILLTRTLPTAEFRYSKCRLLKKIEAQWINPYFPIIGFYRGYDGKYNIKNS